MTIIASIDGPNRLIHLHLDTVGVDLVPMDVYKEMRALRKADETLRKYDRFLDAAGNVAKGGGKFTERYVIEKFGTRIVPYDTSQELNVTGVIITDDGQEGVACFDRTPLTPTTIVDINYVPPQVEVITIIGGSGLDATQNALLISAEFHSRYNGSVYYDSALGTGGDGTKEDPFGTLNDTIDFAETNNISEIKCFNDVTLTRQVRNFVFTGVGANLPTINTNGQIVTGSKFYQVVLEGALTGPIIAQECQMLSASVHGYYDKCAWTLDATLAGDCHIINSYSEVPGTGYMSFVTGAHNLQISDWTRSVGIKGMTAGTHTVHMEGGRFHADATCTGGAVSLRGNYSALPNDLSTGTTITDETEHHSTSHAVWDEPIADHIAIGSTGAKLNDGSALDVDSIADAVWTEMLGPHVSGGNAAGYLTTVGTIDQAALVDAIWDEQMAFHTTVGTSGYYLGNGLVATTDNAAIAAAVWDTLLSEHVNPLTFGNLQSGLTAASIAAAVTSDMDLNSNLLAVIRTAVETDIPATLAGLNDFDPVNDTVALVSVVTTNTDMRGTDGVVDYGTQITALHAVEFNARKYDKVLNKVTVYDGALLTDLPLYEWNTATSALLTTMEPV